MQLSRAIHARFHYGSGFDPLTLLHTVTRRLIMQKARGHPGGLPHFVCTRFQVLFHSPHRGTFHLSLTVLVHYRSPSSI